MKNENVIDLLKYKIKQCKILKGIDDEAVNRISDEGLVVLFENENVLKEEGVFDYYYYELLYFNETTL